MDNAVGTLTISIRPEGAKTRVTRCLKLKKQMIRPADYAAFRPPPRTLSSVDGKRHNPPGGGRADAGVQKTSSLIPLFDRKRQYMCYYSDLITQNITMKM